MSKKRWAILLILISIPLSYYGFSNFEAGSSDPLQAIMISLGCTGGIGCFFGGLYLFFIKEKGRGEILASQTSKDSPILDKIINKPSKKVNEVAEAKESKDNVDSIKTLDDYNEKMKKLFKREDELKTRKKEITKLDKEVDKETGEVQDEIRANNWIDKGNGWELQRK